MKKGSWRFYLYMALLFLPCLELALLVVGYRPYQKSDFQIQSEPAFCILPDSSLGFALQPGIFTVTINKGHQYTVTHGSDSLRISSEGTKADSLPNAFIMGCSYTYGMGVDDSSTYTWRLQKAFPHYHFKNFGVPGYGTVQSLMQLKRQIAAGNIPKLLILGYAGFHMERNALHPDYRRHLHIGFEQAHERLSERMISSKIPYVDTDSQPFTIQHEPWQSLYAHWRGREYLALVNFAQNISDKIDSRQVDPLETTLTTTRQIQSLCIQHDITFFIAGLTSDPATEKCLELFRKEGITAINISVDLDDPALNNMPYDSHPNRLAHSRYAEQLISILTKNDLIPSSSAP